MEIPKEENAAELCQIPQIPNAISGNIGISAFHFKLATQVPVKEKLLLLNRLLLGALELLLVRHMYHQALLKARKDIQVHDTTWISHSASLNPTRVNIIGLLSTKEENSLLLGDYIRKKIPSSLFLCPLNTSGTEKG
ncbi:hypothetical protein WISP_149880 [Willisornis vidua]|uniref:Uncharacterized protein n=1 Tax=Willisornis vidua TaxID=1566151 RepID=A0ABQ9CP83_9PASS|nr:hypothetical protein WISP_149880 [Willisornis vidua]